MTKRKVSKKKSTPKSVPVVKSSSKKKKFSLNTKILLGVAIVVLIIAALFLFVKLTGNVITGNATSFIKDFFTATKDNLDSAISKYVFFVIVLGIVWGALSFAHFPTSALLQGLIAIGVSFLGVAYLTPEEVFTILQSYTSLGITLTFIVPFMIMLFVSSMLVSNEKLKDMSVAKLLVDKVLWIFYLVVLGYKMISGYLNGDILIDKGLNLSIILMIGVMLIVLGIVVFYRRYLKGIWSLGNLIRTGQIKAAGVTAAEAVKVADRIDDTQKQVYNRNNAADD